jgi:hypothetical protein
MAGAAPMSLPTLTWATGETPPGPRLRRTYATGDNVLRTIAAVFTAGISLLFSPYQAHDVMSPPTLADYAAQAPAAAALYRGLPEPGCRSAAAPWSVGAGVACTAVYLLEHEAGADPNTDWFLDLRFRFAADREPDPAGIGRTAPCTLSHEVQLPLGPARGLEARVAAAFRGEMRGLPEIQPWGREAFSK